MEFLPLQKMNIFVHVIQLITAVLILMSLASCKGHEHMSELYYNATFDGIANLAKKADESFCIALVDTSECPLSEYVTRKNSFLKEKTSVLYNVVNKDTPTAQKFSKILLPQIYPITCIFSSAAELIDVVPGCTKESFAYIDEILDDDAPALEFHYNRLYNQDKLRFLEAANRAIRIQCGVSDVHNLSLFDSIHSNMGNPYAYYLKQQLLLAQKDTDGAKEAASRFLSCDSVLCFLKFPAEVMDANNLLDSTYDFDTAPLLYSSCQELQFPYCVIDSTIDIDILIGNKGKKNLEIVEIAPSCNCVKVNSAVPISVSPGHEKKISAAFTPDIVGEMTREIYILSNSKDNSIYTISIDANVHK